MTEHELEEALLKVWHLTPAQLHLRHLSDEEIDRQIEAGRIRIAQFGSPSAGVKTVGTVQVYEDPFLKK